MKIITTLRNNWKKSIFFTAALGYGAHYLVERKRNGELLQAYCLEALKYSKEKIGPEKNARRVIVFLNPIANKERGRYLYDKNVAPLLHLSGLDVRLVRLDKNSEANEYMKEIDFDETDCIVVAGGNATLNEVISGILHREKAIGSTKRIPAIGIVPIGQTNTFAHKWLNMLGVKHNTESEIRLLASSALSIIKGETIDANLMKITLEHSPSYTTDQILPAPVDSKTPGAYSLLKEDKLYALSNFSCGFLTETEANVDLYRYYWRLKNRMNRYFMDRYLRRDPIKYEFNYRVKCPGCSKCLSPANLQRELNQLVNSKAQNSNRPSSSSLLRLFYNKLIDKSRPEDPTVVTKREKRKKELQTLLEQSKYENKECGKTHTSNLTQVQIIGNINYPDFDNPNDEIPAYIDTAIVKDPLFNPKAMFLAESKQLTEFSIRRIHSDLPVFNENINSERMAIEIDGEIYKLMNARDMNMIVRVSHVEKPIRLVKCNQTAAQATPHTPWPKIYLVSKKTYEEEMVLSDEDKSKLEYTLAPNMLPFEKFYLKFWTSREQLSPN